MRFLVELLETEEKIVIKPDDIVIIKVADTTKKGIDLNDTNQLSALFEFSGVPHTMVMDSDMRFVERICSLILKNFCLEKSIISRNITSPLTHLAIQQISFLKG